MSSAIILAIAAVLPFITGFAAWRLSTRQLTAQATADSKAVDAQAYDRAERITTAAVQRLEAQINRLQAERDGLRVERDRLHDLNDRLEGEVGKLRGLRDEAARLTEANQRLEAALAKITGTHGNG